MNLNLNLKQKFSANEKLLEFKIKFVIYILYVNIIIFSLLNILNYVKIIKISSLLVILNFNYIIFSFIGLFILSKNTKYYKIISYGVITALLIIITINLITISNDKFAPVWYMSLIIGTYIALDIKEGIIVTIVIIISILLAYFQNYFNANLQSLNTLFGSILANSTIGFIITDRLNKYDTENNFILHKLNVLANTDYLTSIFNRRAFFENSNKVLNFAKKNKLNVCVFMIDIDFFKKVNDTYGHKEGDRVLQKVVELISHSIREEDIFGRIGGEEFALLIINCDKIKGFKIAEKIRKIIEQDNSINITISLGFHSNEKNQNYNIGQLLHIADEALYEAKTTGRNKVSYKD